MTRIGSLCSGYGGLEMGVLAVLGGTVAWHVEYDADPSRILAHHWPDVPNHGDVKTTDWASVEPIDILTAGYPCQPFSHAGTRKGADDPRHLWPDVARAIGCLRPGLVVLENVRGHVSLGLDAVIGDLSRLGYDARWGVVRASDAGAPHGRARIFITAWPAADTEHRGVLDRARATRWAAGEWSAERGESRPVAPLAQDAHGATGDQRWLAAPGQAESRGSRSDAGRRGGASVTHPCGERHGGGQDPRSLGRVDSEDAGRARERQRARQVAGDRGAAAMRPSRDNDGRGGLNARSTEGRPAEELRGVRNAAGPQEVREAPGGSRGVSPSPPLLAELREQPTRGDEGRAPLAGAADESGLLPGLWDDGGSARSPHRPGSHEQRPGEPGDTLRELPSNASLARGPRQATCGGQEGRCDGSCAWGQYAPAIHRWEICLGRVSPPPTEPGKNGQPRLSPRFVEFMMGLPAGHVTAVPGLSRNAQLKALGNGVVPQQAALALRYLLGSDLEAVAA